MKTDILFHCVLVKSTPPPKKKKEKRENVCLFIHLIGENSFPSQSGWTIWKSAICEQRDGDRGRSDDLPRRGPIWPTVSRPGPALLLLLRLDSLSAVSPSSVLMLLWVGHKHLSNRSRRSLNPVQFWSSSLHCSGRDGFKVLRRWSRNTVAAHFILLPAQAGLKSH